MMKARRTLLWSVLGIVAIAAVAAYMLIASRRPQLELGVGYAARVGCGCHYIGGRPLGDCHKDFEPGMEPIRLADNPATKTITASVPLIATRKARYDPILGCQPERFTGTPLEMYRWP